jgi:glycerol kinase
MLYDLHKGSYDSFLLDFFNIPEHVLPSLQDSISSFGKTKGVPGLPDGIPIFGILGDQQAALLGQDCLNPGEAKITYGTGAFLLMNTGECHCLSQEGLLTTVACSYEGKRTFAMEGAAFIAGAAVQFLRDQFGWFATSAEIQKIATLEPRDPGIIFVPALAGLGAPYWNSHARGAILGLTRGTTKGQICRAVLESIALQNVQIFKLMEKASGISLKKVKVDGGASKNNFLMQFQSDVLQEKLIRPANIETTSKGAALAARKGLYPEVSFEMMEQFEEFEPTLNAGDSEKMVHSWLKGVEAIHSFYS